MKISLGASDAVLVPIGRVRAVIRIILCSARKKKKLENSIRRRSGVCMYVAGTPVTQVGDQVADELHPELYAAQIT